MAVGIIFGLEAVNETLNSLQNPQSNYPMVHITGTNGKGSVASFISSVLIAQGFRVGTFKSPSFMFPNDGILINNVPIESARYESLIEKISSLPNTLRELTNFEKQTIVAYYYFSIEMVDIAVIEVGMGGRLDATNCAGLNKLAAVITSIGYDHMEFLGDTLEKIAVEKSGIIAHGVPTILAFQSEEVVSQIIREVCNERASVLTESGRAALIEESLHSTKFSYKGKKLEIKQIGSFQLENIATALDTISVIESKLKPFSFEATQLGLMKSTHLGRMDFIPNHPKFGDVLIDGAHNIDGIKALHLFVSSKFKRIHWIVGMTKGKPLKAAVSLLTSHLLKISFTEFPSPVDMPWIESYKIEDYKMLNLASDVKYFSSIRDIEPFEADVTVICGSLYLAADFYRIMNHFPLHELRPLIEENTSRHVEHVNKEEFEKFLAQRIANEKRASTIERSIYDKIVQIKSCSSTKVPAGFKFWAKKFELVRAPGSLEQVLVYKDKRVAKVEDLYDILYDVHVNQTRHGGIKKTFKIIQELFSFVPRVVAVKFISMCSCATDHQEKYKALVASSKDGSHDECSNDDILPADMNDNFEGMMPQSLNEFVSYIEKHAEASEGIDEFFNEKIKALPFMIDPPLSSKKSAKRTRYGITKTELKHPKLFNTPMNDTPAPRIINDSNLIKALKIDATLLREMKEYTCEVIAMTLTVSSETQFGDQPIKKLAKCLDLIEAKFKMYLKTLSS